MRKAGLWTDSRYWIQAEQEMDCNWELYKEGKRATWIYPPSLGTQTKFRDIQVRGYIQGYAGPLWKAGEIQGNP